MKKRNRKSTNETSIKDVVVRTERPKTKPVKKKTSTKADVENMLKAEVRNNKDLVSKIEGLYFFIKNCLENARWWKPWAVIKDLKEIVQKVKEIIQRYR